MSASTTTVRDAYDRISRVDERPQVPEGYLLTTRDFTVAETTAYEPHAHPEHELLWCDQGMARLHAGGRSWAVPPALGVWIPSGVEHAAWAMAGATLRTTYVTPDAVAMVSLPTDVTGVVVTDAVRTLLMHNHDANLTRGERLRVQRVLLDMLAPLPRQSFDIVMPHSLDLRAIAAAILTDPADRRTTEDWAMTVGMHPRTLARRFLLETGESFTGWRILARMQLALRELSHGRQVLAVARLAGYRSPGTFIGHFRAFTGRTPAEYLRRQEHVAEADSPTSTLDADTLSA